MRKYFYSFKLHFLNSFHYRFNTVVNLIFGNVNMVITIIFWMLIFQSSNESVLNGFSLSNMITYFVVGGILRSFIFSGTGFSYSSMIKGGGLNSALIKPYSISTSIYFGNLSGSVTGMIPQLVFTLILMPFIAQFLTWNLNIVNIIFLLIFLLISTISSHLLWSILGYMAFWIEDANAVMWSFAVLLNLLTGMFIPLDFFPQWSIPIIEILPFSSWGYIPTKIYLGLFDTNKILYLLLINISWIILLFIINKIIWTIGIRKYSSIGG